MWKIQEFSVIQILREINFGDSRSAETAFFGNFKGSDFSNFGKFQPSKSAKIHKKHNLEPQNALK